MKRIRLFVVLIFLAGMTGLAACGQGAKEKTREQEKETGVENMEKNADEKTQQMIEKAEEMEGKEESDTTSR